MRFVCIDVETANPSLNSICQIGVVAFEDGKVVETWQTLVNPKDYFHPANVSVHGIREEHVIESPSFDVVFPDLAKRLGGQIVAHHSAFDRTALAKAFAAHGLCEPTCRWLDTARVARRAWIRFSNRGFGLANLASEFGLDFSHHIAQEDARVAGEILMRAVTETGISVSEWVERASQPMSSSTSAPGIKKSPAREGNPEGLLFGEFVVFTGALSISRQRAADLAADAGCYVEANVGKRTSLLVVGDQDITRLAGHQKSSKHRKAEELQSQGQNIRVLGESDFLGLIGATLH